MAMVSNHGNSPPRAMLAEAISSELMRQAQQGATRIDVEALVDVIKEVVDRPMASADKGKRPEELNATNDD